MNRDTWLILRVISGQCLVIIHIMHPTYIYYYRASTTIPPKKSPLMKYPSFVLTIKCTLSFSEFRDSAK